MLKITSNFIIDVSGTKFHFKKPTFKMIQQLEAKKNEDSGGEEYIKEIFDTLIKVEDFADEEGNPLDANSVRELNLPFDCVNLILKAWSEEIRKIVGANNDPKGEIQPIE